jgi:hypothetical protein
LRLFPIISHSPTSEDAQALDDGVVIGLRNCFDPLIRPTLLFIPGSLAGRKDRGAEPAVRDRVLVAGLATSFLFLVGIRFRPPVKYCGV